MEEIQGRRDKTPPTEPDPALRNWQPDEGTKRRPQVADFVLADDLCRNCRKRVFGRPSGHKAAEAHAEGVPESDHDSGGHA